MSKKILLVAVMATALVVSPVLGYTASVSMRKHQDNPDVDATDLHFTAYLPEYDKFNYWVNSYTVTQNAFSNQAITPWSWPGGNGRTHGIDVMCWGGTVPYCTWVTITVQFDINAFNYVYLKDVYWTYPGRGRHNPPDHGYEVEPTDPEGNSTYRFVNTSDEIITVEDFQYALNQDYLPADELFEWEEWTHDEPTFTVEPHASYEIPLSGMEPGRYFYSRYDMYVGGELVSQETNLHEDIPTDGYSEIEEQGNLIRDDVLDLGDFASNSLIRYHLSKDCHVTVEVYSVDGQRIATLVDEAKSRGEHSVIWDEPITAGLYIVKMTADGIRASEKMIRLK